MFNVSRFLKENTFLFSACTAGIFIFGYLGYYTVGWIINKCSKIKKINALSHHINPLEAPSIPTHPTSPHWWTKITGTKEFEKFKKNWQNLTKTKSAREKEAQRLKSLCGYTQPTYQSSYSAFLGIIYNIPGNFSFWMPGVALVAAYLAEKKKIEGLYVCQTLEALSRRIHEISLNPANQRYAFVVGTFQSGLEDPVSFGFKPNFPQHKVTVCVEKKEGQLTLALLDAQPDSRPLQIVPASLLVDQIWSGYDQCGKFNSQELVFRAILIGCRNSKRQARLLHSQVLREKIYGCEIFALQDAIAFLRDPDFFNRVACSKEKIKVDSQYEIELMTMLPAEHMIGTQSCKIIDEFRKQGGQFDQVLLGRKKTLQNYLDSHSVEISEGIGIHKKQNHYITKKLFKYLNLVAISMKYLQPAEIQKIISKTLIT